MFRKYPEWKPISKLRGVLIKLDKYEIETYRNKYRFVVYTFSFLSFDKHLKFGSPIDVNEAIKKHNVGKQNDKENSQENDKETLEQMYKEDLKEFLGAAPSSSQIEILASVEGNDIFSINIKSFSKKR